jgi:hypothetical protein
MASTQCDGAAREHRKRDGASDQLKKDNAQLSQHAFERALALFDDVTIADPRWTGGRHKEIVRVREVLCDTFVEDGVYNTPPEFFSRYCYQFALAAQKRAGK